MSITITVRHLDGWGVVFVAGKVDSATACDLEQALFDLLDTQPGKNVAMDASAMDYISSAGLRVLLMGAKRQRKAGAGFAVCGLSDNIRRVFHMGGFEKIVPIFDTLEDIT